MNLLTDVIPAKARKYVYALYALAGIVVGALAIAGVDVGKAPDVIAYVGIALGLTAASNISANKPATINVRTGASGQIFVESNPIETGRRVQAALDAYHRASGTK